LYTTFQHHRAGVAAAAFGQTQEAAQVIDDLLKDASV
jgi:hypothetical protein